MSEPADRRATERYPVNDDTSCSFLGPVVEGFGPAKIKNLSMEGIGLQVTGRVEAGALLAVSLTNAARGFARTMLVRVAHATPMPGGYLVGGTFSNPLTYQELSALVT